MRSVIQHGMQHIAIVADTIVEYVVPLTCPEYDTLTHPVSHETLLEVWKG